MPARRTSIRMYWGETLLCTVPYYRQDLAILEDLAEEVALASAGTTTSRCNRCTGIRKGVD